MQVLNIHLRTIDSPKEEVLKLFSTLSTQDDRIWPRENWPAMRFKDGLSVGASGGHGPIKYTVEAYNPQGIVQFRFVSPKGFNGFHRFEISALSDNQTALQHVLTMQATGRGMLAWVIVFRWLHDALIEDAFDKLENQLTGANKRTPWSCWVKLLRNTLTAKKKAAAAH